MQGDVAIDLEDYGGETVLQYSTDAKVGGLIAGMGQRMIGGVAKMVVEQFFRKVGEFISAGFGAGRSERRLRAPRSEGAGSCSGRCCRLPRSAGPCALGLPC